VGAILLGGGRYITLLRCFITLLRQASVRLGAGVDELVLNLPCDIPPQPGDAVWHGISGGEQAVLHEPDCRQAALRPRGLVGSGCACVEGERETCTQSCRELMCEEGLVLRPEHVN